MRTYSTRKNPISQNNDFDAVFSAVHEQSADTESTVSENETLNSKKRKNKMTKPKLLKRSKNQTPVSKETEISKQTASKSNEDMTINNSDSLFADPMDVGKKNRSRSQKKSTQVSQTQVGSVDKVSQWLAGSQYTDLSEKEIFRDKLHDHPMERRHDMFSDLQCDGLQTKPRRSLSHDPASRVEFLSKFVQKKTIKPTVKQGDTRSWTVSATETLNQVTGSTDIGTTEMDTETATPFTGTMTETQGDLVTAYTDTQTPIMEDSDVTKHMSILSQAPRKYMSSTFRRSISADTFPSELSTVTESIIRKKREEKTPQRRRTDDFKVPSLPTKNAPKTTQKKGSLHPKNSSQLFTSGCVEIVEVIPQMSTKIMDQSSKNSTTAQKVVKKTKPVLQTSTPNIGDSNEPHFQFDIWLLMIFVGLAGLVGLEPAIQQEDISPTKSAPKTTQTKGSLQMSTKIMDQSSKNSTTAQKVESSKTEDIDTAVLKKTKPVLQTSTPNIEDSNEPHFQFDADISSVTDEPENESELVFNQSSRFVNSNELMELSSTQIEQIDENVPVPTARKLGSSRSFSTWRHTDIGQSHEQLVNEPNDNSEFEPELCILPDGKKIFGANFGDIRKTLRFSSSSSTPQGRRGSSNSTGQGKMFTNQTDIGQSPEQLVNEPNDNSEFEPELRILPDGKKIFGANLVSSSSSTPQGRRGSSRSSRNTWRSKMFTYRTDIGKPTERVVNETKDNNNSMSEPELRRLPDGRYVPVCPLMYSGPVRHKKNATNLMFTTKN